MMEIFLMGFLMEGEISGDAAERGKKLRRLLLL